MKRKWWSYINQSNVEHDKWLGGEAQLFDIQDSRNNGIYRNRRYEVTVKASNYDYLCLSTMRKCVSRVVKFNMNNNKYELLFLNCG